jgi:molybdate transport system substrate-binding protein
MYERKVFMFKPKKCSVLLVILMITALIMAGCATQANDDTSDKTQDPEPAQSLQYEGESLMVYSGAGISKAMDEIGKVFKEEYGAEVNLNYANCAQLLSQMEITQEGDVFVGGSSNDGEISLEKGFADKYEEVAYHIPAIGVPKGNPAGITSLADLAKPGVKVILGDEESTAIGKKGAKIIEKNQLTGIEDNVVARGATVNEIVTKIGLKQADAGLIFEDNAVNAPDIEVISIPEEQNAIDKVPVIALKFSEKPELAQAFVDFIMSDEGKAIFAKNGFKVIE